MKETVEMISGGMIRIPSFMKICAGVQGNNLRGCNFCIIIRRD
jgi:hypothetical protein